LNKTEGVLSLCFFLQVTGTERENRQLSEQLAALQSDKDQLEGALYEAQQAVVQLEVRKAQLEGENQELIVRKENLQCEYCLNKNKNTFTWGLVYRLPSPTGP
jgi:uncharacterized protein (DUF3084 family)